MKLKEPDKYRILVDKVAVGFFKKTVTFRLSYQRLYKGYVALTIDHNHGGTGVACMGDNWRNLDLNRNSALIEKIKNCKDVHIHVHVRDTKEPKEQAIEELKTYFPDLLPRNVIISSTYL